MKILICLALLLGGCCSPNRPYIQIKSDDPELVSVGLQGVAIWSNLDFQGHIESSGLDECSTYWQDSWGDCQITVYISAEKTPLDINGYEVVGVTRPDHRHITTSSALTGNKLLHNLAHELGHVLITDYHLTKPGQTGVMWYDAYQSGWPTVASPDDYALACAESDLCYNP